MKLILTNRTFCLLAYCVARNRHVVCTKFSTSTEKFRNVRVRFAPSPTGFLHIGGLRTALLNYLLAKSQGGAFLIRIEDTDQKRIVPGAVENLLKELKWVGIEPDEGPMVGGNYGPYVQSERLDIYEKYANLLLENRAAYRCFCSNRRLGILKRDQLRRRESPRYDNRCRDLSDAEVNSELDSGSPYVLRLKLSDETSSFDDALYGTIRHNVATIEGDPVIFKSDGFPTYHLANVVDDHLMEITHVLRGHEWILSTVKHVMLYEAFGWTPPTFAHLPLLLGETGKKLSKRQGDMYVGHQRKLGYHPTAVLNFMAHYGAGFYEKTGTIFGDKKATPSSSLAKMAQEFSLEKVGITDSIVRFSKLDEFNTSIIKHSMEDEEAKKALIMDLKKLVDEKYGHRSPLSHFNKEEKLKYIERFLTLRKAHVSTLRQLVHQQYDYVWIRPQLVPLYKVEFQEFVQKVCRMLERLNIDDFSPETLTHKLRPLTEKAGFQFPATMKELRHILTGAKEGPSVAEVICVIGKIEAIARLSGISKGRTTRTEISKENRT